MGTRRRIRVRTSTGGKHTGHTTRGTHRFQRASLHGRVCSGEPGLWWTYWSCHHYVNGEYRVLNFFKLKEGVGSHEVADGFAGS